MLVVPWIVTALRGAVALSLMVLVVNWVFGSGTISWYALVFGIPNHVLADFTGFCVYAVGHAQRRVVLGRCYLGIVTLAVLSGVVLGIPTGMLVFFEAWLIGIPGGYHGAVRDFDRLELLNALRQDHID